MSEAASVKVWNRGDARIALCRYPVGHTFERTSCPHTQIWSIHQGQWTTIEAERSTHQPSKSVTVHLPGQPCRRVVEAPLSALSVELREGKVYSTALLQNSLWGIAVELTESQIDWLRIDELVARIRLETDPGENYGKDSWLGKAKDILTERFAHPPSLDQLAKEVGISPSHLSTAFSKKFGRGISSYTRELKVNATIRAMGSPNAWLHGGFYDASHFRREVKRQFGYRGQRICQLFTES